MNEEKDPTIWCPSCGLKYNSYNNRVSRWDKEGKRYERCLDCGAAAERAVSTGNPQNYQLSIVGETAGR